MTSQPRALSARSDDGQWVVVKEPDLDRPAGEVFSVWQWDMREGHILRAYIPDTGQDAADVLGEWLERERAS